MIRYRRVARIGFLLGLLCGPLSGGLVAQAASQNQDQASRPRSVVFYLMDTCRNDRLGFNRYHRETTPFLKWLAERSVVFEACYSQAPWTKPSMASILSSKFPSKMDAHQLQYRLPDEVKTWPEVLQDNGMYTAGFSANILMGNLLSNFAQGFDHFVESTHVNRGDPIRFASGSAKKLNQYVFPWLDQNRQWPVLLYLHSVDPHEEYEPEPKYLQHFADPKRHEQFRQEWKSLMKTGPPIPGLYVTQENFDRAEVDSASFIEHGSNLYDADILANDDQIRQLWNKLQERSWGQDFIFIFTSDHGEEFFDHGGTSHGYILYEEMIRVPLMIYAPGLLPAGKRIQTPVRSLDIYPTLCELLEIETPDGLEGESLLPLIHGREESEPREIVSIRREDPIMKRFGIASGDMICVRKGRWKLILNLEESQVRDRPRLELFDLQTDPAEKNNLVGKHPEVVQEMEKIATKFIQDRWEGSASLNSPAFDPEVRHQLAELGYVEDEEPLPDLWAALESKDDQRIRNALKAGADPDGLDSTFGVSPLCIAALFGDLELLKLLLEFGASVDVRNRDGSTPLSSAAFLGRVEALEYLLEKGADPEATNHRGESILSATEVPWEITEALAGLFGLALDREAVEAGRQNCAKLLKARIETPKKED